MINGTNPLNSPCSAKRRFWWIKSLVLVVFPTISLAASQENGDIQWFEYEYKLDRKRMHSKNRLSGGTRVRTTRNLSTNKRKKKTRGSPLQTQPVFPRDYRNTLGLPRQFDNDRPNNPEDWFFLTASSDDGCRKRTKKFAKSLNFQRGINAPPAVWSDPTYAPSRCVQEPVVMPTNVSTPSQSQPRPSDDASIPSSPPPAPVPSPSLQPVPWIDPTPTESTVTIAPIQSPFDVPPTRDTFSPTFAWFDPSTNPTNPPANMPSPTPATPLTSGSTEMPVVPSDTPRPSDAEAIPGPVAPIVAAPTFAPIAPQDQPTNSSATSNPTETGAAPSPANPIVPFPSAPFPTTVTGQPTSSPDDNNVSPTTESQPSTQTDIPLEPTFMSPGNGSPTTESRPSAPNDSSLQPPNTTPSNSSPMAASQPSVQTDIPLEPTFTTPIPTFPPPSPPDAPPPSLLPPTIHTLTPTTTKPTLSPIFPRPPAESPTLFPGNASPSSVPFLNDIQLPEGSVCQAIQDQSIPPDLEDSSKDPTTFGITMAVQFEFISSDILQSFLDSMNVPVALWIAGCEEDAMRYISSDSKRKKRLQEEANGAVEYSELEPWGVDGSCAPFEEDVTCQTFGTRANVFTNGNVDTELLRSKLVEGLDLFSTLVTNQIGVLAMRVTEIELLNDGTGSGIIGDNDKDPSPKREGVDATVVIGAVAAGLAVFLLTMIWVMFSQRRQSAGALSHSRFEEDWDNYGYDEPRQSRSYSPQVISSDSGVYKEDDGNQSFQYQTRVIPLEGENNDNAAVLHANPSFQHLSPFAFRLDDDPRPFDEAEDIFWTNHPRHGSHECSAATCEICERRRQQGLWTTRPNRRNVRLVPPPSPERVPQDDPERWFVSGDTVQL